MKDSIGWRIRRASRGQQRRGRRILQHGGSEQQERNQQCTFCDVVVDGGFRGGGWLYRAGKQAAGGTRERDQAARESETKEESAEWPQDEKRREENESYKNKIQRVKNDSTAGCLVGEEVV